MPGLQPARPKGRATPLTASSRWCNISPAPGEPPDELVEETDGCADRHHHRSELLDRGVGRVLRADRKHRGAELIIDVHRHMWSARERYREGEFATIPGRESPPPTSLDWEQTTQEIVAEMDVGGVDMTVLLVADFAARRGDTHFDIYEENRFIVEARKKYPNRLISFYGIDPRRRGAVDSFERAIKESEVQGLKIHTSVGFFPHDRVCYPFYELCVLHNLPVLFHVAPNFNPRLYSRHCHPLEFDQVGTDFPNLLMIMGHAGGDWWADCIIVARGHPNMMLDLSGWPIKLRDAPAETLHILNRMRDGVGIERILWANDFPGPRGQISLKECKEVIQRLPSLGAKHGYSFSDADAEAILGTNAQSFLKLS